MRGPITITRKDVGTGRENAVTFEWNSPTNLMETGLSHYEVMVTHTAAEFVETINITSTSVTFVLDDGTYSLSVTAVNKCGERSEPVTLDFKVGNSYQRPACNCKYGGYTASIAVLAVLLGICCGIPCLGPTIVLVYHFLKKMNCFGNCCVDTDLD